MTSALAVPGALIMSLAHTEGDVLAEVPAPKIAPHGPVLQKVSAPPRVGSAHRAQAAPATNVGDTALDVQVRAAVRKVALHGPVLSAANAQAIVTLVQVAPTAPAIPDRQLHGSATDRQAVLQDRATAKVGAKNRSAVMSAVVTNGHAASVLRAERKAPKPATAVRSAATKIAR
ncbi:MAG: hypothetical protein JNM62_01285 [Flavobacteriales bacterium]|nr:hypothetical protein [Flavobacteriales bacterium]